MIVYLWFVLWIIPSFYQHAYNFIKEQIVVEVLVQVEQHMHVPLFQLKCFYSLYLNTLWVWTERSTNKLALIPLTRVHKPKLSLSFTLHIKITIKSLWLFVHDDDFFCLVLVSRISRFDWMMMRLQIYKPASCNNVANVAVVEVLALRLSYLPRIEAHYIEHQGFSIVILSFNNDFMTV